MASVQAADPKEAALLTKWESVKSRHDELVRQLQDETVLSQPGQIHKLNKERLELEELAQLFDTRQELLRQLDEAAQLLADVAAEAELRAMAEQEAQELGARRRELESGPSNCSCRKTRGTRRILCWKFGPVRVGKKRGCSPVISFACT